MWNETKLLERREIDYYAAGPDRGPLRLQWTDDAGRTKFRLEYTGRSVQCSDNSLMMGLFLALRSGRFVPALPVIPRRA
jgi:hypothetical protein